MAVTKSGQETARTAPPQAQAVALVDGILAGIRVPDLPYPVARIPDDQQVDWRPLILSCWHEQRDEPVTALLRSVQLAWTARQVNAAYIADRIMDVFLRTSGLHPELVERIARLRYVFAWQINKQGGEAFSGVLLDWLDSLSDHRGWSDTGGRTSRALLERLDALVSKVIDALEADTMAPVEAHLTEWLADHDKARRKVGPLNQRLIATEQGAARQRHAEHAANALVGRATQGRKLPPAINTFIDTRWLALLRQIAWAEGLQGENWKHATKLLEWLVWVGDVRLSDSQREKLYQVGEQLGDKLSEVWERVHGEKLPADALNGIAQVLASRLRGEELTLEPCKPRSFNPDALQVDKVDPGALKAHQGHWFVEGEGSKQQRKYLLCLLEESGEILWTNGQGVKLELMVWRSFQDKLAHGEVQPLPEATRFGPLLNDTLAALKKVLDVQHRQRQEAAEKARARADQLRKEKEAAEAARRAEEAAREAVRLKEKAERKAQQEADEKLEAERQLKALTEACREQVDSLKLGGWVAFEAGALAHLADLEGPTKLKLAVRINASRKLILVDRFGLNKTELTTDQLTELLVNKQAKILSGAADFEDTLSRVVGRIRVGR